MWNERNHGEPCIYAKVMGRNLSESSTSMSMSQCAGGSALVPVCNLSALTQPPYLLYILFMQ